MGWGLIFLLRARGEGVIITASPKWVLSLKERKHTAGLHEKVAMRPSYDNVTDITPCYLVFYKSATNVDPLYLSEALIHGHE